MKKNLFLYLILFSNFVFSQNTNLQLYEDLINLDKLCKSKDDNINDKLVLFFKKNQESLNDSLIGFYYLIESNYFSNQLEKDEAIKSIILSNQFYSKSKNANGISKSFMNLGNLHMYKGNLEKALIYYKKGIEVAEKNNLSKQIGLINKNIGVLFMNQEKYVEALFYSKKALDIFLELKNKKEIAGVYINIGNVYYNQYQADKSLDFYKKAEWLCVEIKDYNNLGVLYNNIGSVYIEDKKDNKNGLLYLKKALDLKILNSNVNDIIFQHSNLADFYTNNKDFINAEYHLKTAEKMALKSNNKVELKQIYSTYSNMYAEKNDYKNSLKNFKLHTKYKDSILNIESLKSVKELETKYQTTKKEKQIIQQQAEAKQKNFYLIALGVLSLLIGLIGFLIYKQQKQKSQQQAQENQLKSAIAEIENQNKLQEQRLSISRDLHDNIGSQLTFIISSVDNVKYGFDITNEKLDNKLTNISSFAKDTILELRDTIWAMNSNQISFEDLEIRINNFIDKAKMSQENIGFSFAIADSLKTQKLTSIEGMNVYRTLQEAINNTLKYAQANIISVNIKPQGSQTAINIKDNGKGFDLETTEKGNGLKNMQKRIEEIGGQFSLSSGVDGTKIEILI
jgi:signal transduction histidine kinase